MDSFIEQIATELRRPVRFDARFDDRVMEAIEAPEVIELRPSQPRPWILRPWIISPLRGFGALAAAAALAFAVAMGVWRTERALPPIASAPSAVMPPLVAVVNSPSSAENRVMAHQFLVIFRSAKRVSVVGDFNDWDVTRTPLSRLSDDGAWSVTVPLKVGLHEFQFVVDDSIRINDPTVPRAKNGFGSDNSIITIGPGSK